MEDPLEELEEQIASTDIVTFVRRPNEGDDGVTVEVDFQGLSIEEAIGIVFKGMIVAVLQDLGYDAPDDDDEEEDED